MTILNIAVGPHEVAIVSDSRQSADANGEQIALPQLSQKCMAFPALNLLVAHSGSAGMGAIARELESYLLYGVLTGNVLKLSQLVPAVLADLSRAQKFGGIGRIYLAGLVGERAYAFHIVAPTWTVQAFPQCAWVAPALRADLREPTPGQEDRPVTADLKPPVALPAFRDSLYTIRTLAEEQYRQNPITCGGPLIESYIDSAGIRQHVLRTLGAE